MHKVLDNIEEIVPIGKHFELYVTGYSMLPLLGYGRDHIIVRRTAESEDITSRIAMFRAPDRHIVVHRVLRTEGDTVYLQGFGNPYRGESCRRSDIVGVVDAVRRESGRCVSCTTRSWRAKEWLWMHLPKIVRRYALAIMRRWLDYCKRRENK
jgi:hypothetical protein